MRVPAEVVGKVEWHGCDFRGQAGSPKGKLLVLMRENNEYRVQCYSQGPEWGYVIKTEHSGFAFAQPLLDGILLADSNQSSLQLNARVYDFDGNLLREFELGDGIEDIQTTASGDIWASYFDEGVFGRTVAAAGLVRFDAHGSPTYEFQPSEGLDRISDCYALNVESHETVWFYYYTPFLLVRLRNEAINGFWRTDISGARAFAVSGDRVVIHAGYDRRDWRLLQLKDDATVENMGPVEFVKEDGARLSAYRASARGPLIWFVQDSTVYRVDINKLS